MAKNEPKQDFGCLWWVIPYGTTGPEVKSVRIVSETEKTIKTDGDGPFFRHSYRYSKKRFGDALHRTKDEAIEAFIEEQEALIDNMIDDLKRTSEVLAKVRRAHRRGRSGTDNA